MSDLHIDVGQQYSTFEIPVATPCLILAGDIGRTVNFEGWPGFCSARRQLSAGIFSCSGTTSSTTLSYDECLRLAWELESSIGEKLVLLQQDHHEDGLTWLAWLKRWRYAVRERARQVDVVAVTHHAPYRGDAESGARRQSLGVCFRDGPAWRQR